MAQLVLGAAGAAAGFFIGGPAGAQLGYLIGSALGGLAGGSKTVKTEGPRIGDGQITSSTLGTAMPTIYGSCRIAGNVIHCSKIREVSRTESEGGKGGPKTELTTYAYNVDIGIDLCAGTATGIRKIWSDGKLIYDLSTGMSAAEIAASNFGSDKFKFYNGGETQLPDPTLEALAGIGNVPAYRGRCYVVFSQLDCPSGRIPQLNFEVLSNGVGSVSESIWATVPKSDNNNSGFPNIASIGKNIAAHTTNFNGGRLSSIILAGPNYSAQSGVMNTLSPMSPNPIAVQGDVPYFISVRQSNPLYILHLIDGTSIPLGTTGLPGNIITAAYDVITDRIAVYSDFTPSALINVIRKQAQTTPVVCTITIPVAGNAQIAFYNNFVYTVSQNQPLTTYFLNKFNATTGALVSSIPCQLAVVGGTTGFGLCASADGVFVLTVDTVTASKRRLFKVATEWTLVNGDAFSFWSSLPFRATFYANNNYAIVGARDLNNGFLAYYIAVHNSVTPSSASVGGVILDQCIKAGLTSDKIDVSTLVDVVDGYPITQVSSARANIQPILKAFFIDPIEADGKLKFVKRASATLSRTISYEELCENENEQDSGDPFPLTRIQEDEFFRSMTVNFIDVNSDYQPSSEESRRQVTSSINDASESIPICMTANKAKQISEVLLFDSWNSRNSRSGKVSRKFSYLTPGDVIAIEYPKGTTQNRLLTRITDTGAIVEFDAIDADAGLYTVNPPGSTVTAGQSQKILPVPSPTLLTVIDGPILRDEDNNAGIYVGLSGASLDWSGASLYAGKTDLALMGSVNSAAVQGFALGVLGDWAFNMMDERNFINVQLVSGVLSSDTRANVVNGSVNACVLGVQGRWEVMQFTRAELQSAGVYRLSGLKRGLRGTEINTGNHSAADKFAMLSTNGLLRASLELQDINKEIKFLGVSNGSSIDESLLTTSLNSAYGLKPYSPVGLKNARQQNGDILLTWIRRTRLSENWLAGAVPLGEDSELYSIDIFVGGDFKRTLTSTSASVTYTIASQRLDFFNMAVTNFVASVFQVSGSVGRGNGLTVQLIAGPFN